MTTPALDLGLVNETVARLRAAVAENRISSERLKTIEPALAIGDSTPPQVPAAMVYVAADDFGENLTPAVQSIQRARATLVVAHVVETINTGRAAGGEAVDPLALLVGLTRSELDGWRPYDIPHADALALRRGRLTAPPSEGRAVWQDEYIFQWVAATAQRR